MSNPEYLVANPISNSFYEIHYKNGYEQTLNLFNEIIYIKTIVPIKTYKRIYDKTDPKKYGFHLK